MHIQVWPVNKLSCDDNEPIEIFEKSDQVWEIYIDKKAVKTHGHRFTAKFVTNRASFPALIDEDGNSKKFQSPKKLYNYLKGKLDKENKLTQIFNKKNTITIS